MHTRWSLIRWLLARAPLPMLALAASYGVYSFSSMFVPLWVAIVQAAAYEVTYIGLAATDDLTEAQRSRAAKISIGAVVTSILYNTLAGLLHRNPTWLIDLWYGYEWGLSVLHGLPLAWVAYLVADLLLHTEAHDAAPRLSLALPAQAAYPMPVEVTNQVAGNTSNTPVNDRTCRHCGRDGLTQVELMAHGRSQKKHGHCPEGV